MGMMIGLLIMLTATEQERTARNLYSGNALYASCTGSAPDRIECQGFIQGTIATVMYFEEAKVIPPIICYTDGLQGQQLVEIVTNHLRDHPETRQFGAGGLALAALSKAFPCRY